MTGRARTQKRGIGLVVGILVALAAFVMSGSAMAGTGMPCPRTSTETVATDKADYPPGETVHITGAGYALGCDVEVRVSRPDGVVESFLATTDLGGGVSVDYVLPGPPGVVGVYRVDVVGSGNEVLASMEFTDATTAVDIAPSQYATGGAGRVFSVLVRNVQGSPARCVRVTLPAGYSALSVSGWSVAGGNAGWTLALNTLGGAVREFQITKDSGGALSSGASNWARFEISATAPAANANTRWTARLAENTACDQNPSNKEIGVRIGAPVDSKTYTATFRDLTTGAEITPSVETGSSHEYRLRITNTNTSSKPIESASIAVPFCFSGLTLSAGANPVTTGTGTVAFGASVSDNFIRLTGGKLDSSGDFVDVRFTATASCSSGTIAFRTAAWENQEPSNDAAKAFGGTHPTVAVEDANDAPTCGDVSVTTAEDTPVGGNLDCTDADGDSLTYTVVAGPANGDVTVNSATGSFSYEPDANFNGSDSFTYKANDGAADSNVATVTITVNAVNDAPVAAADAYSTDEDTPLAVAAPGVLDNDTDVDGDALSAVLVDDVAHGTLILNADGSFSYEPDANFNGSDSFTYKANDGAADSNVATVTITVNAVNDAPVAAAGDDVSGAEGSAIALDGTVSDVEGDDFTTVWTYAAGAGVDAGATCSFADATAVDTTIMCTDDGTYTATLTATDEHGAVGSDTVDVTVTNVAPVLNTLTPSTYSAEVGTAVTLTGEYTDAGRNDIHVCVVVWDDGTAPETVAGVTVSGSGSCSATRTFTTPGVYTISMKVVDDDGGESNSMTVMISVFDPNGGFVTGGGFFNSPAGAYAADPSATGRANFGFHSKYQKGAKVPSGQTEFQFKAGDLKFDSDAYEWLVVSGARAQYKGTGTLNGVSGYKFLLTAVDGQVSGGGGADKFRIKITNSAGVVLYDNRMGVSDDIDGADPQTIAGGSIAIHKG